MTPELPNGSKIEVVESTDDRLVVYVPPGGKRARSLFGFSIAWNLFAIGIGTILGFVGAYEESFFPLIMLSLFLLVGIIMGVIAVRMSFTRLHILLDRERLAIQRTLMGKKSIAETYLTPDSQAVLVESYQENDVPVYRVEVEGSNRTAKWGTPLSNDEKRWFVDTVNEFLGVSPQEQFDAKLADLTCINCETLIPADKITPDGRWTCPSCGASGAVAGSITRDAPFGDFNSSGEEGPLEPVPALPPASVPADSTITIDEQSFERLRFHLPLLPSHPIKSLIIGFLIFMGLAWNTGIGFFFLSAFEDAAPGSDIILFVVLGFFALMGFAELLLPLAIWRAKISVEMTKDRFIVRWHSGPLGKTKHVDPTEIRAVGMQRTLTHHGRRQGPGAIATVQTKYGPLPLTSYHDTPTARAVGGLILWQLEEFGIKLASE